MNANKQMFFALESLRGVAALAVAYFHLLGANWPGYLMVDFFLVLSGFVLCHSYIYQRESINGYSFAIRRLARLYPLHIITLLFYAFAYYLTKMSFPEPADGVLFTLLQHVTLTHGIGFSPSENSWNYPSWSISVEFWVNMIFIVFITRKTRSITLIILSLLCFVLLNSKYHHLNVSNMNMWGFLNSGMVRGIGSFVLGIVAYKIYLRCHSSDYLNRNASYLEFLIIGLMVFLITKRDAVHSPVDFLMPYLFALAVIVFALERGYLSQFLVQLVYLGKISYSLYLNHAALILLTYAYIYPLGLGRVFNVLLFTVLLIALSTITYRFLEMPMRRKVLRLEEKLFT